MKFIAAKCPNCSGELQVPDNRDFVKCMYCGTDIKVRDAIKIMFEGNVPNLISLGYDAYKVNNFKEAYDYFSKALEFDVENSQAWLGKALSCGNLSTIDNLREIETISYFEKSIYFTKENNSPELKLKIADYIFEIGEKLFESNIVYQKNNPDNEQIWKSYIHNCQKIIEFLQKALEFNSKHIPILTLLTRISENNLKKTQYKVQFKNGNSITTIYKDHIIDEKQKVKLRNNLQRSKSILMDISPDYKANEEKRILVEQINTYNKNIKTKFIFIFGGIGFLLSLFVISLFSQKENGGVIFFFCTGFGVGIGFLLSLIKVKKMPS